jgi:hypothetical protein
MSEIKNTEASLEEEQFVIPKLTIDYPLPLPLEVIDESIDWQNVDFFTEDGQESFVIDEAGFLFVSQNGTLIPANVEGENFNFYGAYISPSENGKDVILEFSCKFANNMLEDLRLDAFYINEASLRINRQKEFEKNSNKWFNKYIFNTKWYYYTVVRSVIIIKNLVDILYIKIVERPGQYQSSGCGCSGEK